MDSKLLEIIGSTPDPLSGIAAINFQIYSDPKKATLVKNGLRDSIVTRTSELTKNDKLGFDSDIYRSFFEKLCEYQLAQLGQPKKAIPLFVENCSDTKDNSNAKQGKKESVDELLRAFLTADTDNKSKAFLLIGDVGSGKSTILKNLAYDSWSDWKKTNTKQIPFLWVPLNVERLRLKLKNKNTFLDQFLEDFYKKEQIESRLKFSEQQSINWRFILDDFDILSSSSKQNLYLLNRWEEKPPTKVVISCRIQIAKNFDCNELFSPVDENRKLSPNQLTKRVLLPLDVNEVQQSIKDFCKTKEEELAAPWNVPDKYFWVFQEMGALAFLFKNPLLLHDLLPAISVQNGMQISPYKLIKTCINEYFQREAFILQGLSINYSPYLNYYSGFYDYSEKLALNLFFQLPGIGQQPLNSNFSEKNLWWLLRSCLLMNKFLCEYFVISAILKEIKNGYHSIQHARLQTWDIDALRDSIINKKVLVDNDFLLTGLVEELENQNFIEAIQEIDRISPRVTGIGVAEKNAKMLLTKSGVLPLVADHSSGATNEEISTNIVPLIPAYRHNLFQSVSCQLTYLTFSNQQSYIILEKFEYEEIRQIYYVDSDQKLRVLNFSSFALKDWLVELKISRMPMTTAAILAPTTAQVQVYRLNEQQFNSFLQKITRSIDRKLDKLSDFTFEDCIYGKRGKKPKIRVKALDYEVMDSAKESYFSGIRSTKESGNYRLDIDKNKAVITMLDPEKKQLDCQSLLTLLKNCTQIDDIKLSGLSLDDIGALTVADWLQSAEEMPSVGILRLSHNKIGKEGLKALLEAASKTRKLQHLLLDHNWISFDAIFAEDHFLPRLQRTTLKNLDLSMNYIAKGSVPAVMAVHVNQQVQVFLDKTKLNHIFSNNKRQYCKTLFFQTPSVQSIYFGTIKSCINPSIDINREVGVVGLFAYKTKGSWLVASGEHAFLVFEGFHKFGQRYLLMADLFGNKNNQRIAIEFCYVTPKEFYHRTKDFEGVHCKRAIVSRQQLKDLKAAIVEFRNAQDFYRFTITPQPESNQYNCLTWALKMLKQAKIIDSDYINSWIPSKEVSNTPHYLGL